MATSPRGLHYFFSLYLYAQKIRAFLSDICSYFSALRCIPQSCAIVGKNVTWNFFQQNGNYGSYKISLGLHIIFLFKNFKITEFRVFLPFILLFRILKYLFPQRRNQLAS